MHKEHDTGNIVYNSEFYGSTIYSSTSNSLYHYFFENYTGNNERYRNCFITSAPTNELFHTFMGTRYIVSPRDPGFYYEKVKDGDYLHLYENKNAYPIIYKSMKLLDEKYIDETYFPYSTEYLMTHTVVKGDYSTDYETVISECDVKENYQFIQENDETYDIILGEEYKNKILYLTFDILNEGEYLNSDDIFININGVKNKLTDYEWQYYNGNTKFDFVIPLENTTTLTVEITKGKFNIQNLKMYTSDMLCEKVSSAQNIRIDKFNDRITCDVIAKKGEYLVTSIPYDKGFSATVNGQAVEVETVNKAFVGFKLQDGKNNIVIKYRAPFFNLGLLVTLFGIILFLYEIFKNKIANIYVKHREIIMYLVFGVLTTAVSLVTYALCTSLLLNAENALELQFANVISWIVSVTFAYVTNKLFVFRSNNCVLNEIVKFYASRLGTLVVDMLMMYILVSVFAFNDMISKVFVQFVVIISNYIISKLIVFKEEENK